MKMSLFLGSIALWFLVGLGALASQDESRTEEGKKLFLSTCALCHGQDGKGDPSMAMFLRVEFKPMDSDYVQKKPDEEFVEIATKGRGKMVPVKGLTEEQILKIVAFIRTFKSED